MHGALCMARCTLGALCIASVCGGAPTPCTGALHRRTVGPPETSRVAELPPLWQVSWDKQLGDRRTELVCIGRDLDHAAVEMELNKCTLTDEEMAGGE